MWRELMWKKCKIDLILLNKARQYITNGVLVGLAQAFGVLPSGPGFKSPWYLCVWVSRPALPNLGKKIKKNKTIHKSKRNYHDNLRIWFHGIYILLMFTYMQFVNGTLAYATLHSHTQYEYFKSQMYQLVASLRSWSPNNCGIYMVFPSLMMYEHNIKIAVKPKFSWKFLPSILYPSCFVGFRFLEIWLLLRSYTY